MSTKTLLTLQEFASLPDEGMIHELDEGELVIMPPPKHRHTVIALRVYHAIHDYLRINPLGQVFHEAGATLQKGDPMTVVRQPDVSFYRTEKAQAISPDAYAGVPDLAVEVISPDDKAKDLNRKLGQYQKAGVETVWVVLPDSREVQVIHKGEFRVLLERAEEILQNEDLFPGWQGIPLSRLFE